LVLGTKSAKYIGASFPKSGHDDDPAESIAVHDCLNQMCDCEHAKQDGEGYRCGEVGKVYPQRIACLRRDVAIKPRSRIRAEARRAGLGWKIKRERWYGRFCDR